MPNKSPEDVEMKTFRDVATALNVFTSLAESRSLPLSLSLTYNLVRGPSSRRSTSIRACTSLYYWWNIQVNDSRYSKEEPRSYRFVQSTHESWVRAHATHINTLLKWLLSDTQLRDLSLLINGEKRHVHLYDLPITVHFFFHTFFRSTTNDGITKKLPNNRFYRFTFRFKFGIFRLFFQEFCLADNFSSEKFGFRVRFFYGVLGRTKNVGRRT